ncbi:SDR family NAD(P)-dependent oxidoreductase [Pseudomonas sp. HK3]|jgi:NAD(P)-dependent dehydrogenase (short-subunit alcohol dehydrogenase family)
MKLTPKGNRVLITGGASGFGKALAMTFAQANWQILIADINPSESEKTVKELNALGAQAHSVICDISKPDDISNMYDTVMTLWQGLDVLINNAGIYSGGTINEVDEDSWLNVIDVNLIGTFRCCHKFSPLFQKQKTGRIVNIASLSGIIPTPGSIHYAATKAAIVNLSQSLRHELRLYKVGVTVAAPNIFPTDIFTNGVIPNGSIKQSLQTMMSYSSVTAQEVAESVYDAVMNDKFLVTTEEKGDVGQYLKYLGHAFDDSFENLSFIATSLDKKSSIKRKRKERS